MTSEISSGTPFSVENLDKTHPDGYFAEDVESEELRAVGVENVSIYAAEDL
ncbi:MAG: hypothetical protein LBR11_08895 [Deltaproteobacteria bacterium]|nr:hypothetical protein [Deltaproteobacteria bacterium]